MAFGNPYGDVWSNEIAEQWTSELVKIGVEIISLSDTTGVSSPEKIKHLFPYLQAQFPGIELGLHLHSTPQQTYEKLVAAWDSGCRRFDSALRGFGGCPMATDNLTGNIATEGLISFIEEKGEQVNLDMDKWEDAINFSTKIFG
jgi:hydroxymethylglutaryl-CoA lyase